MTPGMFNDVPKMVVAMMILAAVMGAACLKGCEVLRSHYTVSVQKK